MKEPTLYLKLKLIIPSNSLRATGLANKQLIQCHKKLLKYFVFKLLSEFPVFTAWDFGEECAIDKTANSGNYGLLLSDTVPIRLLEDFMVVFDSRFFTELFLLGK